MFHFQIMVAALKFFLGSDISGNEEDSDDEEDEVSIKINQ